MPTSGSKNLLYRLALPFLAPSIPPLPILSFVGRKPVYLKQFERIIRRNHVSGAAVLLSSGTEISCIYSKAIHTDIVPDSQTYFRVASITKMAAALVAVRLMDEGILDSDRPVSEMLPNGVRVPELRNIRIGHLLSHTSGLSDPPDLENMLIHHIPYYLAVSGRKAFEPGTSFRYSNLGFGLLGCIFEYLLNLSVEEVFQKYLFQPLNMHATLAGSTLAGSAVMPVIRILPYHKKNAVTITALGQLPLDQPEPDIHYGYSAGSMYTDIFSLLKLTVCLRDNGKPLVSEKYSTYMKENVAQYGRISPTLSYGHGLLIVTDKRISESTIYGHQGFAYGCVDGAFWEESTGNIVISLNGGSSEARTGRLGITNFELCRWGFGKEIPEWK